MNEALKTAVLAILRPLVRYLIGQGWTYGALTDTLKGERLLREAHRRLNAAESPEGPQRRLRLGVYYHEEDA
ncbi:hypothetical protein [Acidithiobacillus sp.]|jgi:hypothetical protein|uniref:hypothetical protein n=1 Tax=Acidithiobacillus sp. TaxID=1872118 RepID=UPI002A0C935B|nr:hypothetical protein [Acidithiobacillus sp.]MDD5379918.1 hypothetical protein [Acidithiobacillus sp.]